VAVAEQHEMVSDEVRVHVQNGSVTADHTTGRLLVSTPQLDDGLFHRSVILMLQHDDNGAQGVVLNKPLGAEVDSVLPGWGEHIASPQTLFQGGPVQLDSALGLVMVSNDDDLPPGSQRLFGSVAIIDLDTPPLLVMPEVGGLRIFAGYAGWSGGQLEDELRRGSWFVVDSLPGDLLTADPGRLWEQVLLRQGDELSFVAYYPSDPELN
jgi:putative transcriptional regulator